jgi:hypothetical protein
MFCRSLFVLFLLAIVLSVLLRYTDSDYSFGIFKLFLNLQQWKYNAHLCTYFPDLSYSIHVYNLTKPEFQSNCWHQDLGYNLLLIDLSSDKLYLRMTIPMIKPDNLIHYIHYILQNLQESFVSSLTNTALYHARSCRNIFNRSSCTTVIMPRSLHLHHLHMFTVCLEWSLVSHYKANCHIPLHSQSSTCGNNIIRLICPYTSAYLLRIYNVWLIVGKLVQVEYYSLYQSINLITCKTIKGRCYTFVNSV